MYLTWANLFSPRFLYSLPDRKADALSASEVRHAELDADIERASELVQQYEAREEAVQKKYDDLENDLEASESDLATAREEIETMEHKSKESENRLKGELSACHEEAKALRKTFEAESAAALQMSLKFEEGMVWLSFLPSLSSLHLASVQLVDFFFRDM